MTAKFDPELALAVEKLDWPANLVAIIDWPDTVVKNFAVDLVPGARVLVRTQSAEHVCRVAKNLKSAELGWSVITVLEHLGTERELIRSQIAEFFALTDIGERAICAISVGKRAGEASTSTTTSGPWG